MKELDIDVLNVRNLIFVSIVKQKFNILTIFLKWRRFNQKLMEKRNPVLLILERILSIIYNLVLLKIKTMKEKIEIVEEDIALITQKKKNSDSINDLVSLNNSLANDKIMKHLLKRLMVWNAGKSLIFMILNIILIRKKYKLKELIVKNLNSLHFTTALLKSLTKLFKKILHSILEILFNTWKLKVLRITQVKTLKKLDTNSKTFFVLLKRMSMTFKTKKISIKNNKNKRS